jgi:hypothetical protein
MVRCTQVRAGEPGVWKCRGDLPKHLRFQDTSICCEVGEILRSEINSFPFFLLSATHFVVWNLADQYFSHKHKLMGDHVHGWVGNTLIAGI